MNNDNLLPGVSGISVYVPRHRVNLETWCRWTGAAWDKVQAVVGRSFRMCGPDENVYTMAATAVLRLILDHDVDPRALGYLALGTESSTDNAAGAIIVKGMVDDALEAMGRPRLARDCEVPELKHACLGGVLGLKGAVRYLRCDGAARKAIVVCGDVALYERGSSGEPTQGAGAVAMLLEARPRLFAIDLDRSGTSSDYRGIDFRKPFARHFLAGYGDGERPRDFPVFNGKYSTHCYLDAVVHALDAMLARLGGDAISTIHDAAAVLLHRPYHHLPQQAVAAAIVRALARRDDAEFAALCAQADTDRARAKAQLVASPRLFAEVLAHGPGVEPGPDAARVIKRFAGSDGFRALARDKLAVGAETCKELGNLYTASLPAWIASAFDDAHARALPLAGRRILLVGYGSGDAAEALPVTVAPTWREAAARIQMRHALAGAVDLDQATYEALHDGRASDAPPPANAPTPARFVISGIGRRNEPHWQDVGVETYRYVG